MKELFIKEVINGKLIEIEQAITDSVVTANVRK